MARIVNGPLLTGKVTNLLGAPVSGVTVTPSASVYTDATLQNVLTPVVTNGAGNFVAYATPGVYTFATPANCNPIESIEVLSTTTGTTAGGGSSGVSTFNTRSGAVTLSKADVTGTSLAAADISAAPLASPTFTGTPAAPTAAPGTNTTQVATTAYADAIAALKANLAGPTFTGTPAAPTAAPGTNSTQLATTAYSDASAALQANLASPTFTGTPAAPTATAGTSTTQLATTAFATTADNLKANLATPTFTGTPAAPTAAVGTNTTQLATTAFVLAAGVRPMIFSNVGNAGASQTIPAATTDQLVTYTLNSATCAFTTPTAVEGARVLVALLQDATGGRLATWVTVNWGTAGAPVLTVTPSKKDLIMLVCVDGANWLGSLAGQGY